MYPEFLFYCSFINQNKYNINSFHVTGICLYPLKTSENPPW